MKKRVISITGLLVIIWLAFPFPSHAYIGPGAGFAFLSSFIFIIGALLFAFLLILTLPFRLLIKTLKRKKKHAPAEISRLIIVGLDGLDPELAEGFIAEGKLPNLKALKEEGNFSPLKTTNPPISPVAWSSFMTGTNPGKHNIFDFLRRDPKTYLPALSSAEINTTSRTIRLGKIKIPVGKPVVKMLRKSVPFWKILGDHGIFSIVLKVPITFPPEKFKGLLLSGLCTPDLKGSQGTFTYYTTGKPTGEELTSGYRVQLEGVGPVYSTMISGPADPSRTGKDLTLPLRITADPEGKSAELEIGPEKIIVVQGVISPWVSLTFKAGARTRIKGIAQFFLKSTFPEFELYLSPVQIDPEKPALPVSHPLIYSIYLSKLFDRFATLGLPQDTWALNERVLTDDGFLQQTYGVHEKLEEIFFHSLSQLKRGLLCCVFDTTDVIQHEFWRYLEKDHPALKNSETPKPKVIEELYCRMDELIGRVRAQLKDRDLLLIVSDHGFKLFRRGVNVNTWLFLNGYLFLKDGKTTSGDWFRDVDWSKTRAYAFGLSGIYLNIRGREKNGIVDRREAPELKRELIEKLSGLRDEGEGGRKAITTLYDTSIIYTGPYIENAPDLIIGFYPGWRHSWESVSGKVEAEVFIDNEKAWSADHCIDHRYVPGVFFSSRKVRSKSPSIQDIAPTALHLFGIKPPEYMDGRVLEFTNKV
ncbi:MAG: alkaline phosphatase family protein [Candidatus Euphemobacter frigidus]|nr:alkaline phosphatase family protein [Candidatus Euphemobacter frigidus]MDP8276766.1 alkaline phosphatase family protein [Candidatus Euphemobacter frigidus]